MIRLEREAGVGQAPIVERCSAAMLAELDGVRSEFF